MSSTNSIYLDSGLLSSSNRLGHELGQGVSIWLRVGLEGELTNIGRIYSDGTYSAPAALARFLRGAARKIEDSIAEKVQTNDASS